MKRTLAETIELSLWDEPDPSVPFGTLWYCSIMKPMSCQTASFISRDKYKAQAYALEHIANKLRTFSASVFEDANKET